MLVAWVFEYECCEYDVYSKVVSVVGVMGAGCGYVN